MIKYLLLFILLFSNYLSPKSQENIQELFKEGKFKKVISLLTEKSNIQELNSDEYNQLIQSFSNFKQYSNSLVYADKMIAKCEKESDTINLVKALNRKAEALMDLYKVKEGISFSEEKSKVFRPQDSLEYQLFCFKWGMLYYHDNQYQKAYDTYQKITTPKYRNLHIFTNNFAITNIGLKNYDTAIVYLKKSIQLSREDADYYGINSTFSNIAHTLIAQNKWDEAKIYLDSIYKVKSTGMTLYNKKGIYKNFYNYYIHKKKTDSFILYVDSIYNINDLIFNTKLNEKITELETSYSREKQLQHKVEITDFELEKSETQKLWGLTLTIILIIASIIVIVYLRFRNIKFDRDRVVTEQQLLRSQMTPHFIFNSLSVIQGMVLNQEENKASIYLSKFSKLMRLILENSRNKTVSLDNELQTLNYYLELQNIRFQNRFTYKISIDDRINLKELFIPPMIIQPFVENITEHAFNPQKKEGEITIDIQKYDSHITCKIIDNGIGINAVKKAVKNQRKSLSTTITLERLQHLSKEFKTNASVLIQDRSNFNEQGTIVSLNIPFKQINND